MGTEETGLGFDSVMVAVEGFCGSGAFAQVEPESLRSSFGGCSGIFTSSQAAGSFSCSAS